MGQRRLLGLGNLLSGLGEDELNVRGRRLVGVDSAVGSVSSSSLLGCLVDLDVRDDEDLLVKTLGLGVGLSVLEQVLDELDGLDGPSGLGHAKLLTLAGSADGSGVLSEGDGSLVVGNLLKVDEGLLDVPASDGTGDLVGVLERGSQVGAPGRGGLGGVDGLNGVSGHYVGMEFFVEGWNLSGSEKCWEYGPRGWSWDVCFGPKVTCCDCVLTTTGKPCFGLGGSTWLTWVGGSGRGLRSGWVVWRRQPIRGSVVDMSETSFGVIGALPGRTQYTRMDIGDIRIRVR